jgi:hypothetical protein
MNLPTRRHGGGRGVATALLAASLTAAGVTLQAAAQTPSAPPVAPQPPSRLTDITPVETIVNAPAVFISNGMMRVKVFLPDTDKGFYRGVRFDWAGMIGGLTYKGHDFYVPWFRGRSPSVRDFVFQDGAPIAAPNTAANGPVEEFNGEDGALGYADAPPGGRFVKIGVGVLQRIDATPFAFYKPFPLLDPGKRTSAIKPDSVAFTQIVSDPGSGYGYAYTKRIRLVAGSPAMVIEHVLKNTGSRTISTNVYDHNFLDIDGQGTPKGLQVSTAAPATVSPAPRAELADVAGDTITYKTAMTTDQRVTAGFKDFGATSAGYDFHVFDPARGVGVRITSDAPVDHAALWSISTVMAIEPFVKITVNPGESYSWSYRYDYEVTDARQAQPKEERP